MKTQENENKSLKLYGSICVALIIGIWLFSYFGLKNDLENRGSFGDMFGGVNALFSGLALAGIIFTILLQRNELKLQREELQLTRLEFQKQSLSLSIQNFESTFFKLIGLHNQIVNDLDITKLKQTGTYREIQSGKGQYSNFTVNGRDVFESLYEDLMDSLKKYDFNIEESYSFFYESNTLELSHYFRSLYRIFKYVDEEYDIPSTNIADSIIDPNKQPSLTSKAKYKYASIVRAQLSDYELIIIFYNCLNPIGANFRPLIEKYSILNNIPLHLVSQEHVKLYNQSAFKRKTNLN